MDDRTIERLQKENTGLKEQLEELEAEQKALYARSIEADLDDIDFDNIGRDENDPEGDYEADIEGDYEADIEGELGGIDFDALVAGDAATEEAYKEDIADQLADIDFAGLDFDNMSSLSASGTGTGTGQGSDADLGPDGEVQGELKSQGALAASGSLHGDADSQPDLARSTSPPGRTAAMRAVTESEMLSMADGNATLAEPVSLRSEELLRERGGAAWSNLRGVVAGSV